MLWLDFFLTGSTPIIVFALTRLKLIPKSMWPLFWVGVLLCSTWEFAYHFTGPVYSQTPSYTQGTPFPLHPLLQPLFHSFGDGGLLLIGTALVWRLCPKPHFDGFKLAELAVLIAWGVFQALVIEWIAYSSPDAWSYTVYPWNPVIGEMNGHPLTLIPMLVWIYAPIAFYLIAIRLHPKLSKELGL